MKTYILKNRKCNKNERSMSHMHILASNKLARSFDHASRLVRSCHLLVLKRSTTPILTNLNSLHPEMLYAKIPSGFGVEEFYNAYVVNLFSLFYYFLLGEKAVALHLNKLKFPILKSAFAKSDLEKIFKCHNCIFPL